MAECTICNLTFDYGKKYCGQCGSSLIESKDILEEIKNHYLNNEFQEALEKISRIPSFSFFYDAVTMYAININIKSDNFKQVLELIQKTSLLRITREEKQNLLLSIFHYTRNNTSNDKLEDVITILNKLEELDVNFNEKVDTNNTYAKIYYLKGEKLFENKEFDKAIAQLNLAADYGSKEAEELIAQIHYLKSKNYLANNKLDMAKSEILLAIKRNPNTSEFAELNTKITEKISYQESRKKKIIFLGAASLIALIFILFFSWKYTHGDLLISTNCPDLITLKVNDEIKIQSEYKYISGKSYIKIPSLFIGNYKVAVSSEKYKEQVKNIELKGNEDNILEFSLEQKTGSFFVTSTPNKTDIYLNNQLVGQTPKLINGIIVGKHEIILKGKDYEDKIISNLTISENKTTNVVAELKKKFSVLISEYAIRLSGNWKGRYKCNQGETGLTLKISAFSNGKMTAVFSFYPLPSNPDVKAGSFILEGVFSQDGSFKLNAKKWINRPSYYQMVDVSGQLNSDYKVITGIIDSYGCSSLELSKL